MMVASQGTLIELFGSKRSRHECRDGTQECVRHKAAKLEVCPNNTQHHRL